MIALPILMWIMCELNAPDWCFVLWWIGAILTIIDLIINLVKLGMKLGE